MCWISSSLRVCVDLGQQDACPNTWDPIPTSWKEKEILSRKTNSKEAALKIMNQCVDSIFMFLKWLESLYWKPQHCIFCAIIFIFVYFISFSYFSRSYFVPSFSYLYLSYLTFALAIRDQSSMVRFYPQKCLKFNVQKYFDHITPMYYFERQWKQCGL